MIDFDALKRANAPLNAFLSFDEQAQGGAGPLADITVGVKANIAVAGMPFHAGLAGYRERIAREDAEVVGKLRAAGAAILGILNMEEGALGAKTDNPHFGPTQNPYRNGYSPGGSSGGSAAAVAAGLCDVALGTDTMGSIRIPASHCGIYGFKPATDRVSQQGLEPADLSLDAIGPMARNLDMLERAARAMSDFGDSEIHGRGAFLVDHGVEIDPQVDHVFNHAFSALPAAPIKVALDDPNGRIRFAGFIQVSKTMAANLDSLPGMSDNLRKLLAYGPRRSDVLWDEDQAILRRTKNRVCELVAQHGFIIMPTVPNPPFPHNDPEPAAQADFTCLANIAGLPAISIPAGWTEDGLPIGVQLVGQSGYEAGLFAVARQLNDKLGAYSAPDI